MRAIKTIGVLTSGGDSPGMNAAIRAVVRTGNFLNKKMIGIYHGYDGLINSEFIEMDNHSVSNIIQRGGTILKSTRSERFKNKEGLKRAYENIVKAGIDGLITIGGDGTFRGANTFYNSYGVPVIGIPGTIDNDLFGTDYTIGYDTALNTVVEAVDKIRDTASSHRSLFFVEVMGGDSGFVALDGGIATGAEAILIPEAKTSIDDLIAKLEIGKNKNKSSGIIIVAEGNGGGGAYHVAERVKDKFNHYEIRIVVLGHMQRGGAPTCYDRVLASKLGYNAVYAIVKGAKNVMVGIKNNRIVKVPLTQAVKKNSEINPELFEMARILSL